VLFALYPHITQNYFILSFLVCLGVLQWSAARHERLSLSLLGPWGLGWPGMIAGLSLTIATFGWFFWATPGLFQPGLAGGELSTLFAAGGGGALMVARLVGLVWQKMGKTRIKISEYSYDD
jgi:hypothetical protein